MISVTCSVLLFIAISLAYGHPIATNVSDTSKTNPTSLDHPLPASMLSQHHAQTFTQPSLKKGGKPSVGKRPKRPKNPFDDDDDNNDFDEDLDEDSWMDSCFPASAQLKIDSMQTIPISAAKIGTRVTLHDGTLSPIFTFMHQLHDSLHSFAAIATDNGTIAISKGHLIHTRDGMKLAGHVAVNDVLVMESGSLTTVRSVNQVRLRGLYNPHTLAGEMIVDGFRVSCYTHAVSPVIGEGLLSPIRAFYRLFQADPTQGLFKNGVRGLLRPEKSSSVYNVPILHS